MFSAIRKFLGTFHKDKEDKLVAVKIVRVGGGNVVSSHFQITTVSFDKTIFSEDWCIVGLERSAQ